MLGFAITLLVGVDGASPGLALYYRHDAYEIERNYEQSDQVFLDGYVISLTNDCVEQSLIQHRTRPVAHAYMFSYEINDNSILINSISRPWYSDGIQVRMGGEIVFTCIYLLSEDRHSFDLDELFFYEQSPQ